MSCSSPFLAELWHLMLEIIADGTEHNLPMELKLMDQKFCVFQIFAVVDHLFFPTLEFKAPCKKYAYIFIYTKAISRYNNFKSI